jgi:hypothetical protein
MDIKESVELLPYGVLNKINKLFCKLTYDQFIYFWG